MPILAIDMPLIALVMESNSPLFVVHHHYSAFLHGPSGSYAVQAWVKRDELANTFVLASPSISFAALVAAPSPIGRATIAGPLGGDIPQEFVLGNCWLHICLFRHVFHLLSC